MSTIDTRVVDMAGIPSVVRQVIRLVTPPSVGRVVDEHHLVGDLGLDSLSLAELAFALEDLFGLDAITPERAMTLRTVGDIIGLIEEAITDGVAQQPSAEAVHALSAQYGRTWNLDD
jgi:acyl carrier protein